MIEFGALDCAPAKLLTATLDYYEINSESGRGLPQSKTLREFDGDTTFAPAFGLRQSSGAFAIRPG